MIVVVGGMFVVFGYVLVLGVVNVYCIWGQFVMIYLVFSVDICFRSCIDYCDFDQCIVGIMLDLLMVGLLVVVIEDGCIVFVCGYGIMQVVGGLLVELCIVFCWVLFLKGVVVMMVGELVVEGKVLL